MFMVHGYLDLEAPTVRIHYTVGRCSDSQKVEAAIQPAYGTRTPLSVVIVIHDVSSGCMDGGLVLSWHFPLLAASFC